jgi:hypothetical protein
MVLASMDKRTPNPDNEAQRRTIIMSADNTLPSKAMELREFASMVAEQLVHELQPVLRIKQFTENSVLLGAYAEATVRRLARRMVDPMRVSTGAVIDYPMPELRQLDLIIWAPFPAPALFEVEDFALVPRSSAFGAIEIKRSNYKGVDKSLEEFLTSVEDQPLLTDPMPQVGDNLPASMGVIPVLESDPSGRLAKLLNDHRVVAIFDHREGRTTVRQRDVFVLVNFLSYVRCRYHARLGQLSYPILPTYEL